MHMDIKTRILRACRELSQIRGFHNMSMDDLAARAGVSKRTVYRYFPAKEAVIEATLDSFMDEVASKADQLLQTEKEPTRLLSSLLNYLFMHGQFVTNPYSFHDLRVYYPSLWQKIDRFRLERIRSVLCPININEESVLIGGVDSRIISAVILASVQTVLNPDFVLGNNLTFEETARQLSKLLVSAVFPE
jgi:AcrR family transcriptional regulator